MGTAAASVELKRIAGSLTAMVRQIRGHCVKSLSGCSTINGIFGFVPLKNLICIIYNTYTAEYNFVNNRQI